MLAGLPGGAVKIRSTMRLNRQIRSLTSTSRCRCIGTPGDERTRTTSPCTSGSNRISFQSCSGRLLYRAARGIGDPAARDRISVAPVPAPESDLAGHKEVASNGRSSRSANEFLAADGHVRRREVAIPDVLPDLSALRQEGALRRKAFVPGATHRVQDFSDFPHDASKRSCGANDSGDACRRISRIDG